MTIMALPFGYPYYLCAVFTLSYQHRIYWKLTHLPVYVFSYKKRHKASEKITSAFHTSIVSDSIFDFTPEDRKTLLALVWLFMYV